MITVTYDRNHSSISVKGHAGSGESGHDLVCASVSILVYTLAVNVNSLKANGTANKIKIKTDSGDSAIMCRTIPEFKSVTMLVFNTICAGFELLAHQYPQNIKFIVI